MENIQKVMQSFRTKLTFMFLLFWTIPNYSLLHNNQLGFLLENTHQNKYNIWYICAKERYGNYINWDVCNEIDADTFPLVLNRIL